MQKSREYFTFVPSLNYVSPEINFPLPLEHPSSHQQTTFESYLQKINVSAVYDSIEKRFGWYRMVMKSNYFDYNNSTIHFPEQLFNRNYCFNDLFPKEDEVPLNYVSFYFFRILFKSQTLLRSYPLVHELFVYLETLLFLIHLQTYPQCTTILLQKKKVIKTVENNFYLIPFLEIIPLISTRKFKIKNGFAYIPKADLDLVACCLFFKKIQKDKFNNLEMPKDLVVIQNYITQNISLITLQQPCQLINLNCGIHLTSQTIEFNLKYLPLCIYNIIFNMKNGKNVMFDSRKQLGVFFFHFGMNVDQFIAFLDKYMRAKFVKEKALVYYFKHCYGLVGSKITEPPWSCSEVRKPLVGLNQFHGCPFDLSKHSEHDLRIVLDQYVSEWGNCNRKIDLEDIIENARCGKCERSCQNLFAFVSGEKDIEITHPNLYSSQLVSLFYSSSTIK